MYHKNHENSEKHTLYSYLLNATTDTEMINALANDIHLLFKFKLIRSFSAFKCEIRCHCTLLVLLCRRYIKDLFDMINNQYGHI